MLRRSGIPPADLLTVYIALIRSILEYSCEVWHSSVSCYLSDKLEKIQKRALRIIYPEQTYKDALLLAGITKLETSREDLCLKTLTKITRGGPLTQYVTQTRSNEHNYFIRSLNNLSTYKCRTDRHLTAIKHHLILSYFFPSYCVSARTSIGRSIQY